MTTTTSHPRISSPVPSSTTTLASSNFPFPPIYSFPPFYSLQPQPITRSSQLSSWSALIQAYCRHNALFSISLVDALPTPLFTNKDLGRSLSLRDAKAVLTWMASTEGGNRAEFITASSASSSSVKKLSSTNALSGGEDGGRAWIFWRRPEEWAAVLEDWVERTGQRGTVLTLYEIAESEATSQEEFWGMEAELLSRCLGVCVKRGKAQVFGAEGSEGVKFF